MSFWLNRDPIGERAGVNSYGFVNNNPLIYLDTDGRVVFVVAGVAIGWEEVLAAGGIAAWLNTEAGTQFRMSVGMSVQQAINSISTAIARTLNKCYCLSRHPTWTICRPDATTDPQKAVYRDALQISGWQGPDIYNIKEDKKGALSCPGGAPGERYYVNARYFAYNPSLTLGILKHYITFSVNCCRCCNKFTKGTSREVVHSETRGSGGGTYPDPIY
jgi:hypothetical protein